MDEIMMALDMLAEEERIREATKNKINDDEPALIFCNERTREHILTQSVNTREYMDIKESIVVVPFMNDDEVIVASMEDFMNWLAGNIKG